MDIPWLKLAVVLIPTIVALWELNENKKKKGIFHRRVLPVSIIILAVFSCWIVWTDARDAKTSAADTKQFKDEAAHWQKEATNWQAGASSQMNRMEGKLGVEEASRRYVEGVRSLSHQFSEVKTSDAVEKFFGSQEERQKLRNEVRQANTKLLTAYQTRFQPVYDLVTAKFDSWIEGVRKRGIKVQVTTNEAPAVTLANSKAAERRATFGNGHVIALQCLPAVVDDGSLIQKLHLQMPFSSPKGSAGEVWTMDMTEKGYTVYNTRPLRFAYKSYQGTADNPIEDKTLVNAISDSLDEIMAYVTLEATSDN